MELKETQTPRDKGIGKWVAKQPSQSLGLEWVRGCSQAATGLSVKLSFLGRLHAKKDARLSVTETGSWNRL